MPISAIQGANALTHLSSEALSGPEQARLEDIKAFTQKLLAGKASSPEHQVVSQLQETQQVLMGGLRDVELTRNLSPENALTAQARLAGSVIGIDMVAKVAGSFSTAVNKLVSMQ